MAYQKKHGDFSLNMNTKKKSEKSPDYIGTIFLDGVEYNFSGWNKSGPYGDWIGGSLGDVKKPKEQQSAPVKTKSKHVLDDDDGIPF